MRKELRRMWEESKAEVAEKNAKKSEPAVTPARRSYHWAMVIIDSLIAVAFVFTIIGIPFTILFGVSAVRRYEKYLK